MKIFHYKNLSSSDINNVSSKVKEVTLQVKKCHHKYTELLLKLLCTPLTHIKKCR